MGFEERLTIIPHMKYYDSLGVSWLPFIMQFNKSNISSSVITTDEYGFRTTMSNEKKISLLILVR